MTRTQIYGQAQADAKTSNDFSTKGRRWYNDYMDKLALIRKRRGQWNVAVVADTASYDMSSAAVAVAQFTPVAQPVFHGLEYARILWSGDSADTVLTIGGEDNISTDYDLRVYEDTLVFNTTPTVAGTLKLFGARAFARWESAATDSTTPELPEQLHHYIAHYLTGMYWLVERSRSDQWQVWNDMALEGILQYEHLMKGSNTSRGYVRQAMNW